MPTAPAVAVSEMCACASPHWPGSIASKCRPKHRHHRHWHHVLVGVTATVTVIVIVINRIITIISRHQTSYYHKYRRIQSARRSVVSVALAIVPTEQTRHESGYCRAFRSSVMRVPCRSPCCGCQRPHCRSEHIETPPPPPPRAQAWRRRNCAASNALGPPRRG